MAKKRKKHHTTHRKSHRVGAISIKTDMHLLEMAGGVLVGAIAKKFIDTALAKQTTITVEPKTVDMIEVAAGGLGFYAIDMPFVRGLSLGIATAASVDGLMQMGVLTGIGSPMLPYRPNPNMAGINNPIAALGNTNNFGFPQIPGVGNVHPRRRHAGMGK